MVQGRGVPGGKGCALGKLITDLRKDLADRKAKRLAKKAAEQAQKGIVSLTGPEDEEEGDGENSIPNAAAWQEFRQLQGWQSEEVLGELSASVVHREWEIYRYRLARGLLSRGGF